MGFEVRNEGTYDSLYNLHPDGRVCGGSAVLSFLVGLETYLMRDEIENDDSSLTTTIEWYRLAEQTADTVFFPTCQALLDCMWGDGGDPMECYSEDDYEFFVKRGSHSGRPIETEEQFLAGLRESRLRWKPIPEVISGVRVLLDIFNQLKGTSLEGFYQPEHTIPDFEALLANLELLAKRGNKTVRLNFH